MAAGGNRAEIVPRGLVGRRADDDHAIGLSSADIVSEQLIFLRLEGNEGLVAALCRCGAGAAEQAVIEGVDGGRSLPVTPDNDDGDGPRLALAQPCGAHVDVIAKFGSGLFDPAARGFGNGFRTRQRAADGRLADPGALGNVDGRHAIGATATLFCHGNSSTPVLP